MENYLRAKKALFAFNIWDINSAKAVMDAASVENKNIILQTSASLYRKIPQKQLREFISSYETECGVKTWLHLDHCRDMEIIEDAIRRGWDSVMIDASDKPIEENIRLTNLVTEKAHEKGVLVETEIGQVQGCEDGVEARNAAVASTEDIDWFLAQTSPDMLAVAFGNAHGIYQGEPDLHYGLVEYTVQHTEIPFVVHGGSGMSDEVIHRLLSIHGVKKINISTEVKMAYQQGIEQAIRQGMLETQSVQPIKVEEMIHNSIQNLIRKKLQLLNT